MAVKQVLTKYYEGLSTDDKPTGVLIRTVFRETDTRATYITYDGTNWEVADRRVRITEEDGTFVDIPREFDDLETALALLASAANLAVVDAIADAIKAKTDAMGILTQTGGTVTTDGNEQNVYISNAPSGNFEPISVKINVTAHTATETITIKEYYRNASGGAWLEHDAKQYVGTIAEDEITVKLDPNRYGVKVTIKKDAGTNRAYVWEAMYKVVP